MTAAELDAMVGEIYAMLEPTMTAQPMTALGPASMDPDTFWQVMRRVQARIARNANVGITVPERTSK